ncbi:MAG: formyltetrahydrofolate deformylase [Chloroflexia bacterium]|nr:formyltetrahydrofolate deformylase [Chloroflexia bacterium]
MTDGTLCQSDLGRLVVRCPDQAGIIAAVSGFLFEHGANIVHSDQHSTDPTGGRFFLRIEFALANLEAKLPALRRHFAEVAAIYRMDARFSATPERRRVAIFVSREDHCLIELLWRHGAGEIPAELVCVIGNHPELAGVVSPWSIPFHHVPIDPATKARAEARQEELLAAYRVELVVLARYMQVLSPQFVAAWHGRAINIHHSFLPAFAGARPFHQASVRGVKLIGATAHYVTGELDAGPIIDQDVHRVDHRHDVADLRRISRQIERTVLARAVTWHLEDRVLIDGNRTIVFS